MCEMRRACAVLGLFEDTDYDDKRNGWTKKNISPIVIIAVKYNCWQTSV